MTDQRPHNSDKRGKAANPEHQPGDASSNRDKTYEFFEKHDHYWIVRHRKNNKFYVVWYDSDRKQTRRRSLKTRSSSEATAKVERLIRDGVQGDPVAALREGPMTTFAQALDYYQKKYASDLRSADAAVIAIKHLKPVLGAYRITSMHKQDFLEFAKDFQDSGHTLGYTSRVLSVARSALNQAENDGKILRAPRVPEIRGKAQKEAEPLRGRDMTTAEIALLFDNNVERHLLEFLVDEVHSAARPEALLETHTSRIDWSRELIDLNPAGRVQTKKYRPILRIAATWAPWLEAVPEGPLISYDGVAVRSVKKAMQALVKRTHLTGRINATSIRHSIGRYMEDQGVPDKQISVFLGHEPVARKRTTRRYSPTNPYHPDYLREATAAIERFVHEINEHSRKWDLLKPFALKPGWKAKR